MGKKLIVFCALAGVAVLASYAASDAQTNDPRNVAIKDQIKPNDIDKTARALYIALVAEKREGTDEAAIVRHARLLNLLTEHIAQERVRKAISDLESVIKEMPESEQAKKAAAALSTLKSEPTAASPDKFREPTRNNPDAAPSFNPSEPK